MPADAVILVVPCYNEAKRLDVAAFQKFSKQAPDVSFLFVNDGSTDDTSGVLKRLAAADPSKFRILDLPGNRGKAEAVRQGVLLALKSSPAFVGYWDADLATPIEEVSGFLEVFRSSPEIQWVFGSRVRLLGKRIDRQAWRHYVGRVFATAASLALDLPVYDTQCGAKLFRVTPGLESVFQDPFGSRWIFDVELLARLKRQRKQAGLSPVNDAVFEYPLARWQDVGGSKVNAIDGAKAFFDIVKIYWTYLR